MEPIIQESNCVDIYYDIVRTGRKLWISAYIKLNKDELSVRKFKMLQTRCIAALSEKYTDFYFELLPDIVFTTDDEALTNHIVNQSEEVDQNAKFAD